MFSESLQFWDIISQVHSSKQEWKLENEITLTKRQLLLRKFQDGENQPILIIPPNAGHHSNIAQRLILNCMNSNHSVYSIDWINATQENKSYSINDMIYEIKDCVDFLNSKVHIFGLCQGAWAGAIYTALYPNSVLSYSNGAGPIDFRTGKDPKIKQYCDLLPMSFFESIIEFNNGIQLGDYQLMAFKNMNFVERWYLDYMDLWELIWNGKQKAIQRWKDFRSWYEYTIDLDGKWFLEAVKELFKLNKLIQNKLFIHNQFVKLSNINCPVYLLAGGKDDITLPEQVFAMEDHVSTKKFFIKDAGHIGVFMKKQSLDCWSEIIDDIKRI